ncbi:nickel-responsive transcriptional regulator NikR [Xenophilus sp. Marseille-Q4582]|uniref:nickel-responsive transcriptional regulator NikR n=1 Tax=Xenophilus sp. Marseille-Q4582 TaxID=2866600 RepID=UPI001CE3F6D7|nr:nickel-responsive transcriptional regulator NikR [Xenophilus sp. Marseille-Q4582]
MERFTISLDDELAHEFDHLIATRGYGNRSEAVRDILRGQLARLREDDDGEAACVASLSYVYAHHERELSERLARHQHAQHELTIAAVHAHLDPHRCLETVLLKGPARQVRQFADALMAERGVHHGQLNLVPTALPADERARRLARESRALQPPHAPRPRRG